PHAACTAANKIKPFFPPSVLYLLLIVRTGPPTTGKNYASRSGNMKPEPNEYIPERVKQPSTHSSHASTPPALQHNQRDGSETDPNIHSGNGTDILPVLCNRPP
ncbi:unnamed protein product, partial [Ectocarpus fasciculatus]